MRLGRFIITRLPYTRNAVELLTYIAERYEGNSRFGMTKAAKILYYVDKQHYLDTGKIFTGLEFFKYPRGPFTKTIYQIIGNEKHLDIDISGNQDRIVTDRDANTSIFGEYSLSVVDKCIEDLWDKTADEVSEESHGIAWELVEANRGPIPIESYALGEPNAVPQEIDEFANSLISELEA